MEIKNTEKGRGTGNISIAETVKTLAIGESWRTPAENPNSLSNVRTYCSRVGRETGRFFTVTTDYTDIIIKRTI